MVLLLETSIAFRNGDFPSLLPNFQDFLCDRVLLSACCIAFSARTDLSPPSPTRTFNTSFSTLTTQTHPSPLLAQSNHCRSGHNFSTCLHLAMLFSFVSPGIPNPWLFFFLHVHVARVSSNLLLTSWLTTSLSDLPPSPAAIGSLFRAPSTRCRMLLLHCCES